MKKTVIISAVAIVSVLLIALSAGHIGSADREHTEYSKENIMEHTETAVFAAGCFWCTEAVFSSLKGVISVVPGYTGGHTENPTYEEVCTGKTGHAEAARIVFDPKIISYRELLDVFWHAHDPTTLNRQGGDIGTQYRSAVFYTDEDQKKTALESKNAIEASGLWSDPVVTEISKLGVFYVAENYHHDYFSRNPGQPYCSAVIAPKVRKIQEKYKEKLK